VHRVQGAEQTLTEIYLIGNTAALSIQDMRSLPGVDHVVRVSEEYRVLGRHKKTTERLISITRRQIRAG
jgi:3-deoxy-7-phosphoheptulonate synthase